MVEPLQRGEQTVPWATRSDSSGSSESSHSASSWQPTIPKESDVFTSSQSPSQLETERSAFFPGEEQVLVEESPLPLSPSPKPIPKPETRSLPTRLAEGPNRPADGVPGASHTAPGALGPPASKLSSAELHPTDSGRAPVPPQLPPPPIKTQEFTLDPTAPARAVRPHKRASDRPSDFAAQSLASVREEGGELGVGTVPEKEQGRPDPVIRQDGWGDAFKVEWICLQRLPFYRTRHLRNPWNHDREVKVSRDGTELEPTVGQALLDEWRRVVETPPAQSGNRKALSRAGSSSKRGGTGSSKHSEG
jgi:hypothetical protein